MKFYFTISMIIFLCAILIHSSKSKYHGVSFHKKTNKWRAVIYVEKNVKDGGTFEKELDAAKKVNQMCDEYKIERKNLEVDAMPPSQEVKEKTSQYKGVSWSKQNRKWYAYLRSNGKNNCGGMFKDEQDAAKRVNQLCEEVGITAKNPGVSGAPNQQVTVTKRENSSQEKSSQYKGVRWHKKNRKWFALLQFKGGKQKYGGCFSDELNAAKRVNQLCQEFGLPMKNHIIDTNLLAKKQKTSQYKGVHWHKSRWYAQVYSNGKHYGGCFNHELDAIKRVNQLCQQLGIPVQNPEISAMPDKKENKSQYKGVYWHKQSGKWRVQMSSKGNFKYGGMFENEVNAAKRVNQLCEKLGIPRANPEISAEPNQEYQKKENTSQYKGVYWQKERKKWYAVINPKGQKQLKQKHGGYFKDELAAAKKVNQLCEELGIPGQNLEISEISNQQYQEDRTILFDFDAIQAELKALIKILDENSDPSTLIIKKNLIAAIKYGDQARMAEINLRTKTEESALSIAAKHGFSNAVKFLILKGAEKEHFTNEHHTPLSLAVSQNHFKVVQVLFEDWISPNSHEKPYLHMSPIFNVKSREIAQLLVDNDAITHDIYNEKNQSPLTVACQNGYLDVVGFFLDDGLDINHLDKDNKTPLFYALTNKHYDVVNFLISKGAENGFLSDQTDNNPCEENQKNIMSK